jgi:hypothetical protein
VPQLGNRLPILYRYHQKIRLNYVARIAHPLLVVFSPAGSTGQKPRKPRRLR